MSFEERVKAAMAKQAKPKTTATMRESAGVGGRVAPSVTNYPVAPKKKKENTTHKTVIKGESKGHGATGDYTKAGTVATPSSVDTEAGAAAKAAMAAKQKSNAGAADSPQRIARAQEFIRTTSKMYHLPNDVVAAAMRAAATDPEAGVRLVNRMKEEKPDKFVAATLPEQPKAVTNKDLATTAVSGYEQKAGATAEELASGKTQGADMSGVAVKMPPEAAAKRDALVADLTALSQRATAIKDASSAARLAGFADRLSRTMSADSVNLIEERIGQMRPAIEAALAAKEAELKTKAEYAATEQGAPAQTPETETPPTETADAPPAVDSRMKAEGNPKDDVAVTDLPPTNPAIIDASGNKDKKPEEVAAMDITPVEAVTQDRKQMGYKEFTGCSDCPRCEANRKAAATDIARQTGKDPAELLSFADGKCEGSCIRKQGDKFKVVSNKTGKLWPQSYDTREKAQGALAAYHMGK